MASSFRVCARPCAPAVREYAHRLRVPRACQLIEAREPLGAAAVVSGLCDQRHMTRVFVAITGMRPSQLRRSTRG